MKPGARTLGVAESFAADPPASGAAGDSDDSAANEPPPRSTLAGVVTRTSRVVDGLAFGTCTVGGTDATDAVVGLVDALDREDVRYVMVAGIAPAWYNVLDLHAIAAAVDRPVCSVTFEASEGLEPALRREFDGPALETRLATYRAQPERVPVELGGETRYVRAVGLDDGEARDLVRAVTPEGGRPEPVRVARLAARAADAWRRGDRGA